MEKLIFLIFVPLINCLKIPNEAKVAGCEINIKQLPRNTPLLLTVSPSTRDIIYPDYGDSIINLKESEQIKVDCPGTGNLQSIGITTNEITVATCITGSNFEIAGRIVDISKIECSSRITSVAKYTGQTCWEAGKEIEVGLQIQDGNFLRQYTSCFDEALKSVIYSRYHLTKQIGTQITGGTSPSWSEDHFYNLTAKVNNIYPKVAHRSAINRQLGLDENNEKYVKSTGHYYIAKGHLTAKTDFMYNAQQMSTFHYVNSAPQWQTFNGYNWFYFERNLRNYASNKFVDLEVYTGTYGVSTLPHEVTGEDVELHLFVEGSDKALPIPELFWKIVYDPLNKAGVVVLGINNPYQTQIDKSIVCNDIADKLTWLTFDRFRVEYGYLYACTIDDFRNVMPHIPRFDVQYLLN